MSDSESEDDLRPHELGRRQFESSFFSDSDDEPEVRDYDSDSCSVVTSTCSGPPDDISNHPDDAIVDQDHATISNIHSHLGGSNCDSTREVDADLRPEEREDFATLPAPRTGRSIADHLMNNKEVCLLSFDLEHCGEYGGIIQLSAEMTRIELTQMGSSSTKDTLADWATHSEPFNSYVNPGDNALWDDAATAVHGIRRSDPRIVNAPSINAVWADFVSWFNDLSREFGAVILVAWNGENCDLKWLWKICQSPNSPCQFPDKLQYFMDPWQVVKHYTSCPINPSKSKLESLSLGSVYKFLFEHDLDDAHDSLVDCRAQRQIVLHEHFVPFINRKQSIQPIAQIFKAKDIAQWKRQMEPVRPVHDPWIELVDGVDVSWEPDFNDRYTGPRGGPPAGPTQFVMNEARRANSLADIFLAILPLTFFTKVSQMTHKYCYEDWVVEKEQLDSDGNIKHKKILKPCTANTSGARHRVDSSAKYSYSITPGFVLAWVALLVLQGGHFGSDKRTAKKMWRSAPEGYAFPYVRNTMTSMSYEFMRAYIHFADNDTRSPRGTRGYDVLFKIRYAMNTIINGIRKCWHAGKRVTIDESMIRYMGRAVNFVQYMPAKPIKHGIKVYAVCCAISRILLGYDVYLGKLNDDRSTIQVVEDLLQSSDLLGVQGRELFTDNYYTSVELAILLFEKYRWTICGTYSPTDKKTRLKHDVPFLKLSNGARNAVPRGWYREAVLEMRTASGKLFYIQVTTWRDKKQVMFIHTNTIGRSINNFVRRHVRGERQRNVIRAPLAQKHYRENFNAVDINDRDSADYSTSIRTVRYYIRMLCWSLDRVIHACYVIVCECAKSEIGLPEWKKYLSKHNGRHDFQIHLALALMSCAISLDWDGQGDRPDWMRQKEFVPCNCKKCYFCKNGHTGNNQEYVAEFKCGKRLRLRGCSDERMKILNYSDYCRLCYRNNPGVDAAGNTLNNKRKRAACRRSSYGCPICKEPICATCWPTYDHGVSM